LKSGTAIYQSKVHVFFTFICALAFCVLSWGALWNLTDHGANFNQITKNGQLLMIAIVALLLTALCVHTLITTVNLGKPIATIQNTGIVLRNGTLVPWNEIEDLSIHSLGYMFFTLRTDLHVQLTKGKKMIPFVKLTQERLADLIEEAKKS
jgi:hypothetical protein